MELKSIKQRIYALSCKSFNRTAYGIEIRLMSNVSPGSATFNRTAYGIEIDISDFLHVFERSFNRTAYGIEIFFRPFVHCFLQQLLIAPLMELKYNITNDVAFNFETF